MPLNPHLSRTCPYLREDDHLWLSPDIKPRRHGLYDAPFSLTHRLDPQAQPLMAALQAGCSFGTLERVAASQQISPEQLTELVGFLNVIGALHRERPPLAQLHSWAHQLKYAVLGIRYAPLSWRAPYRAVTLCFGLLRASKSVIVLSSIVAIMIGAAGFWTYELVVATYAVALSTFLSSLVVHELGHAFVIGRHKAACVLMQQGRRFGLLHGTLPPAAEMRSAIAGPAAGLVFCFLISLALLSLEPLWSGAALVIGIFHLGSFLPWSGDAVSLRRGWQRKRGMA